MFTHMNQKKIYKENNNNNNNKEDIKNMFTQIVMRKSINRM